MKRIFVVLLLMLSISLAGTINTFSTGASTLTSTFAASGSTTAGYIDIPRGSIISAGTLSIGATRNINTTEQVDAAGLNGFFPSMIQAANGNIYIAYYDSTLAAPPSLKLANQTAGGWVKGTIAVGSDQYPSLIQATDDGYLYLAYFDDNVKALKLANQTAGGWVNGIIDNSGGNQGYFPSLLQGSEDRYLHIAYYDNSAAKDLKLANETAGGWVTGIIDAVGNAGRYPSMIQAVDGNLYIAYYDLSNAWLKLANQTAGGWVTGTIDLGGDIGLFPSLIQASDGYLYISYYDKTNGYLKLANQTASGWVTGIIDAAVGAVSTVYSSLKQSSDGYLYIAYYDSVSRDLKLANQTATGWVTGFIDTSGVNVGQYPSMVEDSNGNLHIAYQDLATSDLKYTNITYPGVTLSLGSTSAYSISLLSGGTASSNIATALTNYGFGSVPVYASVTQPSILTLSSLSIDYSMPMPPSPAPGKSHAQIISDQKKKETEGGTTGTTDKESEASQTEGQESAAGQNAAGTGLQLSGTFVWIILGLLVILFFFFLFRKRIFPINRTHY